MDLHASIQGSSTPPFTATAVLPVTGSGGDIRRVLGVVQIDPPPGHSRVSASPLPGGFTPVRLTGHPTSRVRQLPTPQTRATGMAHLPKEILEQIAAHLSYTDKDDLLRTSQAVGNALANQVKSVRIAKLAAGTTSEPLLLLGGGFTF